MAKDYSVYKAFHFHWVDYLVLVGMLVFSTGIGIYFGYFKRYKQSPEELSEPKLAEKHVSDFGSNQMHEYLLGSRRLHVFPVAMSLIASYVSGVTILGTVSEIYKYGTQYWVIIISVMFMGFAVALIYIPVFQALQVSSSYEYLDLRFNYFVRGAASLMFVMDEILFLPLILYVPALALNQASGLNIHFITLTVCVICVIYTLVGGIKAVVHTDAWQILVMFLSVTLIVLIGTVYAGGPIHIMEVAQEGGRINFFNTSTSLYERHTLWSVLIGGFSYWTSFNSVNQTMVQRYLTLSTLFKSQMSVAIFTVGIILFISLCCFSGLLVYEFYKNCDPLEAGLILKIDQLLPVYVMQTVGNIHGMPGIFVAGVFGAALSSLSVVLNSTALVLYEDILRGCFKLNISPEVGNIIVKGSIVVLGTVAVGLVFILDKLGGILSVATSVTAIAASTSFGIFTLGILIPWSNSIGTLIGAFCGACVSLLITIGTQSVIANGLLKEQALPISIADCSGNITLKNETVDNSNVFPMFRLSYHWINPIGIFTTVIVGIIMSFLTCPTNIKTLDADLLSPVIHRYLPEECFPRGKKQTLMKEVKT